MDKEYMEYLKNNLNWWSNIILYNLIISISYKLNCLNEWVFIIFFMIVNIHLFIKWCERNQFIKNE